MFTNAYGQAIKVTPPLQQMSRNFFEIGTIKMSIWVENYPFPLSPDLVKVKSSLAAAISSKALYFCAGSNLQMT